MSVLELRGLTKQYRGTNVVDCVSFAVRSGEVTGYLGPNGSGKSTTVRMIIGLIERTAGQVLLNGREIREDMHSFKQRLGYVPEEAILYPHLTGLEYLQLIGRLRELPETVITRRAGELLHLFLLHPHRHVAVSNYSKGMKQRILISASLLHDPDLLILDEPLSGMDVTSAELFKHLLDQLAARGKMILYISHVLEVVERVCSRIVILHRGRVVADDSVDRLRSLMSRDSLNEIFTDLVEERDLPSVAREMAEAITS